MENAGKQRTFQTLTPPHIGIIGAGISGLRCADILIQRGFQVTILEGRNRVGGRVNQTRLPISDHLVDTGANWIHGTDHNPILDLAKQTNTTTHSWGENEKASIFDEYGKPISADDSDECGELMWGIVLDAFKYSNKNTTSIPAAESLHDYFCTKVEEYLPETETNFDKKRKIVLQIAEMWGAFVGGNVKTQSLKFFWLEECIEGENLFCAGTYQKMLERIAKPALEKADIRFSSKVVKVATTGDGNVELRTDKDERFQFDEVVVTAPLGWLKKNESVFSPPLPKRLSKAIDSIGYGCLEKVYLSFPRAFWTSQQADPPTNDHLRPKPSSQDSGFAGFCHFLSPKYSPLNPQHWVQEAVELQSLPGNCSHPTLLFYIFGSQSHELAANLADLPPSISRHDLLTSFFQPYYSRLPHYCASDPSCVPISSYATEWLTDALAGNGSYSNFQTGLEEGDRDIEVMREGLPDRGTWFAGEHTAPFVALGTVTGAYWSGEGVARRIAAAYGIAVANEDEMFPTVVDEALKGNVGGELEKNIRGFSDLTTGT